MSSDVSKQPGAARGSRRTSLAESPAGTLTAATEIAKRHDAEVDIDGPTGEEWDA
jgi:hypothetical protein